jgi:hypothetical protein
LRSAVMWRKRYAMATKFRRVFGGNSSLQESLNYFLSVFAPRTNGKG